MQGLFIIASAIIIVVLNTSAQARHRHHHHHRNQQFMRAASADRCIYTNGGRTICGTRGRTKRARATFEGKGTYNVDNGRIIGSRPAGCPHAYCGCGLRKYLGLSDVRLNLASNWARIFPRAPGPAAGLVAVRPGHVMYIEASAGNGQWLIRDYNSGGGLSRLHVRGVRGYVFVDPRGHTRALVSASRLSNKHNVALAD
jgi:hypothetical protein